MDQDQDEARREWFRSQILPLEPQLHGYARRLCFDNGLEPQDLVHETFLKLMAASNWRDIDSPQAFAIRTLHNLAMTTLRRGKIVSISAIGDLSTLDALSTGDEAPGPDVVFAGRDELRALQEMVATLPPQCRRVFTLRKIYDLPISEVAEQLGISVSTAEKHLTKALRVCSEKLARRIGTFEKRVERSWRLGRHQG